MATVRELAIRVTGDSSSYVREMNRASNTGTQFYRAIGERARRFDAYIAQNNRSIQAMHMQLTQLKASVLSVVTAFAGGFAFTTVVNMADDWGQMAARIKMAITSVEGSADSYNQVQDRLLEISNRNAKAIGDSQELYVSIASSMRDLGYSTSDTLDLIESMSNSYTMNATSSDKVKTSIDALSKSMITGKVSGDQWKQLMASTPNIVTELANSTGKTEDAIKAMGLSGLVSMRQLADAMINAKNRTAELADGMGNTVKDGFTQISNSFQHLIGELNGSTGVTQNIASGLKVVADNIDLIAGAGAALITVGVGRYFGSLSTSIIKATQTTLVNRAAQVANYQAQLLAIKALQEKNVAEVNAARFEAQRAVGLKANLIAQNNLTAAINRQTLANTELAAAQSRVNVLTSKMGLLSRAGSGLLGVMGGPVGLIATVGILAASFIDFSGKADDATESLVDMKRPIDELIEKYNSLNAAQQKTFKNQTENKIELNITDAENKFKEIEKQMETALSNYSFSSSGSYSWMEPPNIKAFTEWQNTTNGLLEQLNSGAMNGKEFAIQITNANEALLAGVSVDKERKNTIELLTSQFTGFYENIETGAKVLEHINDVVTNTQTPLEKLAESMKFPNIDNQIGSLSQQLDIAKIKMESGSEAAYILAGLQRAAGDEAIKHADALYKLAKGQEINGLVTDETAEKLKSYLALLKEGAKSDSKKSINSYKDTITQLNEQIAATKKLTEYDKIRYNLTEGKLKSLLPAQKVEIENLAKQLDLAKIAAEQKKKQEQLYKDGLKSAKSTSLNLLTPTQRANYDEQEESDNLNKWYAIAQEVNADNQEKLLEQQQIFEEAKTAIQKEFAEKRQQIIDDEASKQLAATSAILTSAGNMFGGIAEVIGKFSNESGIAYKAMFALSKGFAIADAALKLQSALMQAMADPTAFTPAQKFANYAAVAAAGGSLLSSISSISLTGMAHDGIDNIPQEGTWLLQKGERVLNPRQNKEFTEAINSLNNNGKTGDIIINNYGNDDVSVNQVDNQTIINIAAKKGAEMGYQKVSESISNHTGAVWTSLTQNTNAKAKL